MLEPYVDALFAKTYYLYGVLPVRALAAGWVLLVQPEIFLLGRHNQARPGREIPVPAGN